jgi:hypothetical protein
MAPVPMSKLVRLPMLSASAFFVWSYGADAQSCTTADFIAACNQANTSCDQGCDGWDTCGTHCAGFVCHADSNGCYSHYTYDNCTLNTCGGQCSDPGEWCESSMDCCFIGGNSQYCDYPGVCRAGS